jgi:hypothetical protein
MIMEYCTPEFGGHSLKALNLGQIRKACIEACLEAMVNEIRFTYTDMLVIGAKKR